MVLMPIIRPAVSRSGPPEFPGLIAVSVWIMSLITEFDEVLMGRPSAETIPVVSVRSRPKGFPIARTFWPTLSPSELPNWMVVSIAFFGGVNLSTAMSFS